MNLLALDTSTEACSVALQWQGKICSDHRVIPRQHNQHILPMIQQLLAQVGIKLAQLDAIVVGVGPGSFVGVRLAVSVAQGLAYGADLPLIGVSSLQIWAQTVFQQLGHSTLTLAIDAHMRAFYVGRYQLKEGIMQPQQPDQVVLVDQSIELNVTNAVAVGNAWETYDLPLSKNGKPITNVLPEAQAALALARLQDARAPEQVLPVYLREASLWQKVQ